MKYLIILFFCFQAYSQPLKTPDEVSFEVHHLQNCFNKKGCKDIKFSGTVISGSVGDVQMTGVWKFSGDTGKVGGQAWFKVNKHFWLGGETVTSLGSLDADHEIFASLDFNVWTLNILPYIGFYLQSEHFGGAGVKVYSADQTVAFGVEYRYHGFNEEDGFNDDFDLVVSVSAAIHKDLFEKFQGIFFKEEIPDEIVNPDGV